MGYVQFILERKLGKRARPGTPASPAQATVVDLPGFRRREERQLANDIIAKKEYNMALKDLRKLNKAINSMKGPKRKETRQSINAKKQFMEDMLSKIGTYTDDNRMYGFREVDDEY